MASERAEAIIRSLRTALPANVAVAVSAVILLWSETTQAVLLAWIAALVVLNSARMMGGLVLLARGHYAATLIVCGLGAFVCGCLWTVPLLVGDQLRSEHGIILIFIVGGITAGSAVLSTAHAGTPIAFITPILSVAFYQSLVSGGVTGLVFASNIAFYTYLLIRSVQRAELNFCVNSRQRAEAVALATSLETANAEAVAAAAALHRMATRDSLTGLLNRSTFRADLTDAVEKARLNADEQVLLLIDVDHFKQINDTLGHAAGDHVLAEVAARLDGLVRGPDLVARLGGDEFAMLASGPAADGLALSIMSHMVPPVMFDDQALAVSVSVGVATFPWDAGSASELLSRADLALYAAKRDGRNCFRRFDEAMQHQAARRHDLEADLSAALDDGSVQVWFQPQMRVADGRLAGFEALVRWFHPRYGPIPPPEIVAIAMGTHRAESLTGLVMERACRLLAELGPDWCDLTVAVNVSPRELGSYDVARCVRRSLARYALAAPRLEIEITEEAMIASDTAVATLNAVKATGVRLAIDDFGTGYSSLAYLKTLSVDRIKIDRSFVTGFAERESDTHLVRAMLGLGSALGIEMVAEGVETESDLAALHSMGCGVAQGYHFARPMAADTVPGWMANAASRKPPAPYVSLKRSRELVPGE